LSRFHTLIGDGKPAARERLFVVVLRSFVPDLVRNRILAVIEPRHRFGQRERRALGIGEIRVSRQAATENRRRRTRRLSSARRRACHTNAAAVDLAGAKANEFAQDFRDASLIGGFVQGEHGLHGVGQDEHRMLHTGVHGWVSLMNFNRLNV